MRCPLNNDMNPLDLLKTAVIVAIGGALTSLGQYASGHDLGILSPVAVAILSVLTHLVGQTGKAMLAPPVKRKRK